MLKQKHKLYSFLTFLCLFFIYLIPKFARNHFFVIDNVSTNDTVVFLLFPIISLILLLLLPFAVGLLFPQFADFDRTMVRRPLAKIRWYLILFFSPALLQ